ncbi:MAG TPA: type II secretion system protein GspM [Stellaceae bacterium]|nr:type II secretion system protein GspM [Stellaceae bacterium]
MKAELSPPFRRFAALGLLLTCIAAFVLLAVVPLMSARGDALAEVKRLTPLLRRERAEAAQGEAWRSELRRLQQQGSSASGLLGGSNESLVAAALQERLKGAVEGVNATLKSVEVTPARDDGAFRRITARVELSGSLGAVQRAIYALEASPPYLFLDNLEIGRHDGNRQKAADDPLLDVTIDVYGYMRKPS